MSGKVAKQLRKLSQEQFSGYVNDTVIRQFYRRTKRAWTKCPTNERPLFLLQMKNARALLSAQSQTA